MRYFKAIAQTNKPFIIWSLFASSLLELQRLGLEGDPLIVEEESIPGNVYDVCPLKIEAGELVARTAPEMAVFETEYNTALLVAKQIDTTEVLKAQTFVFDGQTFPMHDSARLYYGLIEKLGGNRKVRTATGVEYDLVDTDIPAFIIALDNKLLTVILR